MDEELNQHVEKATPIPVILPISPNQNARTSSDNSLIQISDSGIGWSPTPVENIDLGFNDPNSRLYSPIVYSDSYLVSADNNAVKLTSNITLMTLHTTIKIFSLLQIVVSTLIMQ